MAVDNQAAASLPPVDKEKMSPPPLPVAPVPAPVDDKIFNKQMAVLVQVEAKPASSLSIAPPQAVMPSDNNKNKTKRTTTFARAADPFLILVCLWALLNAVVFAVADVATLIINRTTPCTKSTSLFRCATLTHAAAAEAGLLLYGELLCSAVVVLAAPLHMLLMTRTSRIRIRRRSWGAVVVDALAWVALAATAGIHIMEIASDRIFLAADSGDTYIFVDVVCGSALLTVDLLVGVLLCCCSVRLELGEQRGHDDVGEV